ncbi:Intracellular ribonuclease LX [Linum perenne]
MMMMKAVFLFLILVLSLTSKVESYDYHKLALQWPAGYCNRKNCIATIPGVFTIHGLWPTNRNAPHIPKPPKRSTWTEAKLYKNFSDSHPNPALEASMHSHWPQLLGPQPPNSDWGFWFQEWKKHGTVSGMIPMEYFNQAIVASRAIDPPLDSLIVAGIVPSNSLTYTATKIKRAVQRSAAVKNLNPTLSCVKYGGKLKGKHKRAPKQYILKEILFCFDKTLTPIKCPSATSHTCGNGHGKVFLLEP